jgi:hypothetical protein
MIMPMNRIRRSASATRWLSLACLVPFLAFAQAPAPAQPAPPPDAKDAPKAAAPAPAAGEPGKGGQGWSKATPLNQKFSNERFPAPPGVGDTPPATGPLAPLSWLTGCWWGDVNKHEFREYWHPLRGDMMIGVSRLALPERVTSYEYLRLENRPDGVFYVAAPKGKNEVAFKLASSRKEGDDEIFTFSVEGDGFPTSITYRRATGGWLYVEVAGKAQGQDHKVTYPFRRVRCEDGEFIRK